MNAFVKLGDLHLNTSNIIRFEEGQHGVSDIGPWTKITYSQGTVWVNNSAEEVARAICLAETDTEIALAEQIAAMSLD